MRRARAAAPEGDLAIAGDRLGSCRLGSSPCSARIELPGTRELGNSKDLGTSVSNLACSRVGNPARAGLATNYYKIAQTD